MQDNLELCTRLEGQVAPDLGHAAVAGMEDLVLLLVVELAIICKVCPSAWGYIGRCPRVREERLGGRVDAEGTVLRETGGTTALRLVTVSHGPITHIHDETGGEDYGIADLRVVVAVSGNQSDVVEALLIARPKRVRLIDGVPLQSRSDVDGMPSTLP